MTLFLSPYASYVWAAYAISLAGLALTVLWTVAGWRKAKRTLAAVQHSETNL